MCVEYSLKLNSYLADYRRGTPAFSALGIFRFLFLVFRLPFVSHPALGIWPVSTPHLSFPTCITCNLLLLCWLILFPSLSYYFLSHSTNNNHIKRKQHSVLCLFQFITTTCLLASFRISYVFHTLFFSVLFFKIKRQLARL